MSRRETAPRQTTPVKFNFDTVLGAKGTPAAGARPARSSYTAEEVEMIRREALAQGKANAEAGAFALRSTNLDAIARGVDRLIRELDAAVAHVREQSADVALLVGCKLAAAALEAFPRKEVEALLVECLAKLHREPRIVIRASETCAEELRADIDGIAQAHGYAGRIVILAESGLSGSDCRIEWADGGIERDLTTATAAIEQSAARWRSSLQAQEN